METTPVPIEYAQETPELTDELKGKVDKHMEKLTRKHKDVTGASIALRRLDGDSTQHAYQARVTIYHKPGNVVATEKGESAGPTLMGALDAAERQVRKQREVRREKFKSA